MLFWHHIKSNSKLMFAWLITSSFQFVIFGSIKINVYKTFVQSRNGWWWKLLIRMFLKSWHQTIWHLFACFKTIALFYVLSIQFVKHVFSAKIWFLKTSTKFVKCESHVIKLKPDDTRKDAEMIRQKSSLEAIKQVASRAMV